MSRYKIRGKQPHIAVAVGWDNPLATFFAQVWDKRNLEFKDPDDEDLLVWVGCVTEEIRTVEHLAEVLSPYATLPEEIQQQLTRDRAARNRTGDRLTRLKK